MRRPFSISAKVALAASLWLSGSFAFACSVPVFRYALDHWPSDAYRLEVSAAAAKDEGVAKFLRNHGASSPLNLTVVRLPDTTKASSSRLWSPRANETGLPPVWSAALDTTTLATLTNSPTRHEIVKRILAGESAVWVLIESGNREVDEAAAKKLSKRLTFLESAAMLPPIDPTDPTSELGPGPALRVKFSMIRVHHDDPVEAPLVAMITGPKKDSLPAAEPILAPVFGRGRVLGAWPAKDLEADQIDEACLFVLSACSCQVKQLNPGWDLLLAVDWDEQLQAIGFPKNKNEPTKANAIAAPETVTISGGGAPPSTRSSAPTPAAKLVVAGITLVLLAIGALAWHNAQAKS